MAARNLSRSHTAFTVSIDAKKGISPGISAFDRAKTIITAIKNGEAPNGDLVALAGLRSKHNTYMSVPLIWTMINQHTTALAGGNFGITSS